MSHVLPGDPLRVTADEFNIAMDAGEAHRRGQINMQSAATRRLPSQPNTILVRNDSGLLVGRFGVLGIDSPLIAPDVNEAEFVNHCAVAGVTPAAEHAGRFVILTEPLEDGKIGLAWVSGACPVQISMQTATDSLADVCIDDCTQLLGGSGCAQILWADAAETYPATVWGLVRIGGGGGGLERYRVISVYNDYLECDQLPLGESPGEIVQVEKPLMLQHVLSHYPGIDGLSTVNPQKVTASVGSLFETWYVTPLYVWGGETPSSVIWAAVVDGILRDINVDARAWACEP